MGPERERRLLRAAALVLALALPVAALLLLGWQRRWVSDDAYIDLRIVDNLRAGYGPVYNVGQRVETYTNPLWVALLTGWSALGLPLAYGSVLLGLAFSAVGLLTAELGALRLARLRDTGTTERRRILLPLGALIWLAIPAVSDFSTSGLETGLSFGWLGISFWLLAGLPHPLTPSLTAAPSEGRGNTPTSPPPSRTGGGGKGVRGAHWYLTAFALGLGVLVRPDLALFSLAFLAAEGVAFSMRAGSAKRALPGLAALLGCAAALPLAYQIFRMGYFASLVPNTALAKQAGSAYWSQGFVYLWDLVGTYALWLPLALVLGWWAIRLARMSRARDWPLAAVWLAPILGAALDGLYVVRVGGDFMHARMLLPSLFGLLLPLMVVPLPLPPRSLRSAALPLTGAIVVAWAIVCAGWLRVPYAGRVGAAGISDERGYYARLAERHNPVTVDDYVNSALGQDGTWLRGVAAQLAKQRARVSTGAEGTTVTGRRGRSTPSMVIIPGFKASDIPLSPAIPPRTLLVTVQVNLGLTGYLAGPRVDIVDRFGLNDPIGSRLEIAARGRPGHEKGLPNAWVLARFVDPSAPLASTPAVVAARAALGCGSLAELDRAIDQPLTARRFLTNLADAWRLRDLRIPPDPHAAQATFCGRSG